MVFSELVLFHKVKREGRGRLSSGMESAKACDANLA